MTPVDRPRSYPQTCIGKEWKEYADYLEKENKQLREQFAKVLKERLVRSGPAAEQE